MVGTHKKNMLKKIIYRFLAVRHPWRYIGFDELSELYASTMLRSLGLSLVGIFVPIYLYKLGYELPVIFLFMAGVFGARMVSDIVSGYLVAWQGPKHVILASNIIQTFTLILLLTLSQYHWPLWLISGLWGLSLSMFFIAYHVDFSKIMHLGNGGKELGFMTIMERVGAALGPVAGGVIATVFGPEYTIMTAIILFVGAVIPLFLSAEPTALHQQISYRGLPYRRLRRDFLSFAAFGAENTISISVWPLFAAVTILTVNTYANIGLVTSLGVIAAIVTAQFIGRVVDREKGATLLRGSVVANFFLHLLRPLAQGFGGVLLINIANEVVTTGYKLPYTKGTYARADDLPGFRIVYLVTMEVCGDIGKAAAWLVVWALCFFVDPVTAIWLSFFIIAAPSLLIAAHNFPSLRPR